MGIDPKSLLGKEIEKAIRNGTATVTSGPTVDAKEGKLRLVAAKFTHMPVKSSWVIPVVVPSIANSRDWRTRSNVTKDHRAAVSKAFGPKLHIVAEYANWYHGGLPIKCTLTRLGGKRLDHAINLPMSLKAVEDAVALFIAADDGDPRWICVCDQEPSGPTGVRIELEKA